MALTQIKLNKYIIYGLSTDVKPTGLPVLSDENSHIQFHETDTGRKYLWLGSGLWGEILEGTRFIDENGLSYGVKHVDNKPRVSSMPYLYDIAEGNVLNHKPFSKLGYNADVGAAEEIISAQGGAYVMPAAEQHMHVVSSSIEDDPVKADFAVGTGLHSITIYYLTSGFVEKKETVTLNGTTAVETTATDIFRINSINAETTGTGNKAAGNISVKNHAETITYGYIAAGNTKMRQAVFTVPVGKKLYIVQFNHSTVTAAGKACTLTLKANYDELDDHILASGFYIAYAEITSESASDVLEFDTPLSFKAGVDVIITGFANASTIVSLCFRGWIENA